MVKTRHALLTMIFHLQEFCSEIAKKLKDNIKYNFQEIKKYDKVTPSCMSDFQTNIIYFQKVLTLGSCMNLVAEEYGNWGPWSPCTESCGQGTSKLRHNLEYSNKWISSNSSFLLKVQLGKGTRYRTRPCTAEKCVVKKNKMQQEFCSNFEGCPDSNSCQIFFGNGFKGHTGIL